MKKKWIWLAPLAILAMLLFIAIGGEIVQQLWNWLLPALFGWRQITFWQALGLLVLCRILFGGYGGHGHDNSKWRGPKDKRWEGMTPEEREKFRQDIRSRWCGCQAPANETKEQA